MIIVKEWGLVTSIITWILQQLDVKAGGFYKKWKDPSQHHQNAGMVEETVLICRHVSLWGLNL